MNDRQYRKWEKEHIEELLTPWELEQMRKFDTQRKALPIHKRLILEIKEQIRTIVSRFRIMRMGKGRVKK